jgi:hypothetical protein
LKEKNHIIETKWRNHRKLLEQPPRVVERNWFSQA